MAITNNKPNLEPNVINLLQSLLKINMGHYSMFLIDSFRQKGLSWIQRLHLFHIQCDCCDDPGPPNKSVILAPTPSAHSDPHPRVGHHFPKKTLTRQNLCWDDGCVMCAATTGWTVTCNSRKMKPQQCYSWNNKEIKDQTEFGGLFWDTWTCVKSKKNEHSNRSPKNKNYSFLNSITK